MSNGISNNSTIHNTLVLIIFLCISLLLLPTTVRAAIAPTFSVVSAEGEPGKTVTVYLNLENCDSGFVSLNLSIEYDSDALILREVIDTDLLPGRMHTTEYVSPYYLTWVNDVVSTNYTSSGTLVALVFEIKDSAVTGEYEIKVNAPQDGVLNSNGDIVTCSFLDGKVIVPESTCSHLWGDWIRTSSAKHIRTCNLCGESEYEWHDWDDGVIILAPAPGEVGMMLYTCASCGFTKTEALDALVDEDCNHQWNRWREDGRFEHARECELCGFIEHDNHNWDDGVVIIQPTDESSGQKVYTCSVCGGPWTELLPALGEDTIPATGIQITSAVESLAVGATAAFSAVVEPPDASDQRVFWSSSDPSVATVTSDGIVTAIGPGNTFIIAATVNDDLVDQVALTVEVEEPIYNYALTYDANGGSGAPEPRTKVSGVDLILSSDVPTREGYVFMGWAESSTATVAQYQPGDQFTKEESTILYAVWMAYHYTVTYNANGGSGAPAAQTNTFGIVESLSDTVPTRNGYMFLGWAEDSAATVPQFMAGGNIRRSADTALYAVWRNTGSVVDQGSFGNGVTWRLDDAGNLIVSGSGNIPDYSWPDSKPPWDDYFDEISYVIVEEGVTGIGSCAFYDIDFTSAVIGNGVSSIGERAFYRCAELETLYIPSTVLSIGTNAFLKCNKLNLVFYGGSNDDWLGIDTQNGNDLLIGSEIRYAIDVVYTVTFKAPGGSGAPTPQAKVPGVDLILSRGIPIRNGYTFLGWAESSTAKEAQYQPGGSFTKDANTTLYAIWSANTYTLTYDANGGTGAPAVQTKTHGVALTLSDAVPTREGYTFLGWAESSTDTEAEYQPGGSFTKDESTTLYAVWKQEGATLVDSGTCGGEGDGLNLTWSFESTGTLTISGTGAMADWEDTNDVPWAQYHEDILSISLDSGVSCIGDYAFNSCYYLTEITIPAAVTRIGWAAFFQCYRLENVTLADGLTSISGAAFKSCYVLRGIEIPSTVTELGSGAFMHCYALTEVTIPDGISEIAYGMFYACSLLQTVHIPESVTSIAKDVFTECTGLTDVYYGGTEEQWAAVEIGEGESSVRLSNATIHFLEGPVIPVYASGFCGAAGQEESVTWTLYENGDFEVAGVGAMGSYEWYQEPWRDLRNLITGCISIGDGVTSVGDHAFFDFDMTTSIRIAGSVSRIGGSAFSYCDAVTELQLGEGVKEIGDHAFSSMTALANISIPSSVKTIGYGSFLGCDGLLEIAFSEGLESIGTLAFGSCGQLQAAVLPDSLIEIAEEAFKNDSLMETLCLGNGLSSIGSSAFSGCSGLSEITFGTGLKTIEAEAFAGCVSLTEIQIPSSVEFIGDGILNGCYALQAVTIPFVGNEKKTANDQQYKPIGYLFGGHAFDYATRVAQHTHYVPSIGFSVRDYYYIPDSLREVTVIGGDILCGTFEGCSNLTHIRLLEGVSNIDTCAFQDCSALKSVTIATSVGIIGAAAFDGCVSLTDVCFEGTSTQWAAVNVGSGNEALLNAAIHYGILTVTFDANGGNGSMSVQTIPANTPTALSANAFSRADIDFTGWNTLADGSGISFTDEEEVILTNDITLYAQWVNSDSTRILTVENVIKDGTPACRAVIHCSEDGNVTAYAARYDENGRFLSVEMLVLHPGENEFIVLRSGAATLRFFVLHNVSLSPVCEMVNSPAT